MKKLFPIICTSLLALTSLFVCIQTQAALPTQANGKALPSLAPMLKNVLPAVVNIYVIGEMPVIASNPFPKELGPKSGKGKKDGNKRGKEQPKMPQRSMRGIVPRKFEALGSGVIIDAQKGYLLTNAHVLRNAKTITVTLKDGRHFKAKLIGADQGSDIAILQIKATKLKSLQMANSDKLNVGDFVVAIGSPFGLNQTVTSGIVSALKRSGLGIEGYENFIQTDAPINPGNSGGALVNLKGQLIGINTAILAPGGGNIGIGFAIPSNMVKSIMTQLLKYGAVHRGLMGVMIQTLTPNLADAFNIGSAKGALVSQVNINTPAAKAGFKPGDLITKVNGHTITNAPQVTNIVGLTRVGAEINLQILRNKKSMTLTVETASPKQYKETSKAKNPFLYGMNMRNFSQLNVIHGDVQGVQILAVSEDSPAWRAMPIGIQPGDVIVSANGKPVYNTTQLKLAADNATKNKNGLLLNILRDTGAFFVVIK